MLMARRIALLLLAVVACLAQTDSVERPTFLRTHSIYSARSEMILSVRIVPHPDIRTVILEAWERLTEDEPDPVADTDSVFVMPDLKVEKGALIRSSVEDAGRDRAIYTFTWRYGLDPGDYVLVAKAYLGRGLHKESAPKAIMVR